MTLQVIKGQQEIYKGLVSGNPDGGVCEGEGAARALSCLGARASFIFRMVLLSASLLTWPDPSRAPCSAHQLTGDLGASGTARTRDGQVAVKVAQPGACPPS